MKLEWSHRAARDLRDIGRFIARDNPSAARRWLETLRQQAKRAAQLPMSGRMVPEYHRERLREIVHKNYRIVYLVGDGAVHVLTVFEAHRLFPDEVVTPPG